MSDKDLVQKSSRNLGGKKPFPGPVSNIEDKLLAVTKFHEEAGCCLCGTRCRHPGSTGDDPYLIGIEVFAVGSVEVSSPRFGWRNQRFDLLGLRVGCCLNRCGDR
ncbi:MAG: hypothetical protein ABGX16_17180 [Pirellulales bacterium]